MYLFIKFIDNMFCKTWELNYCLNAWGHQVHCLNMTIEGSTYVYTVDILFYR